MKILGTERENVKTSKKTMTFLSGDGTCVNLKTFSRMKLHPIPFLFLFKSIMIYSIISRTV